MTPFQDSSTKEASFFDSALTGTNKFQPLTEVLSWLRARQNPSNYKIRQLPLDRLERWQVDAKTGDIFHDSGKFFSIEGLRIETDCPDLPSSWEQPIINQPEIGVLGILTRVIDGVRYFLMQAKMEPGNINLVQLSPTVQATRSNFTRVHEGRPTRYLNHFIDCSERILFDQLLSEHGTRFLRKRNRNMIVEVDADIEPDDDFRWLTLAELKALMVHDDDLLNMDARSVLSLACFVEPFGHEFVDATPEQLTSGGILVDDASPWATDLVVSLLAKGRCMHDFDQIISWITNQQGRHQIAITRTGLADLADWSWQDGQIVHAADGFFRIVGIEVEAFDREVAHWHQPILHQRHVGLVGLLCRTIGGVLHFLIHAKVEPGLFDILEVAPTVSLSDTARVAQPPFMPHFTNADPRCIRFDRVQSEEGGRFFHTRSRTMVVELEPEVELDLPEGYLWVTFGQILQILRYRGCLNMDTRSLLSCLGFGPELLAART